MCVCVCVCIYGKKKELLVKVKEEKLLYKPKQITHDKYIYPTQKHTYIRSVWNEKKSRLQTNVQEQTTMK